ncbi:hypothetical protein DYB37_012639 [Aphanomyces astaci]|uniref:CCHC-type domain-containing protein n=1 Tax=Aphanomyces astaci TaxID=112090 RepID=A0A397FMV8_APHAT|nr:hypothetical protein DYB37_012639 [Aphanomyces astaci]RHZ30374.1 hypothetical protein DYB26_013166 [Aphanomyces astaci]RHZ31975.1 hypothetical protein DYB31_011617 [Aphanomyces astaci]
MALQCRCQPITTNFNRDHDSITNDEWVAWFKSALEEDTHDLDVSKPRLQREIHFDKKILDAESRVGHMLDELMCSLEQYHQEWVLRQEGKMVVEVIKESLKTVVQKQLQLQLRQSNALKSEVFRGRPQVPRREGGWEDATKNNGRVGGKAGTIVPKNAEPSAKKGCLTCGDMSHRVARCPKTAPGKAEALLTAQVKLWKDGIKVLVN